MPQVLSDFTVYSVIQFQASSNWFGYITNGTLFANEARVYYRIVYPEKKCCIKLLMYMDWEITYLRAHMNCLQRTSIIATNPKQIIKLSPSVKSSGCTLYQTHRKDRQRVIECNSGRVLRANHDQEWFFAVSSCGSPSGLTLNYTITMYGLKGDCPVFVNATLNSSAHHMPSFFMCFLFTYFLMYVCH